MSTVNTKVNLEKLFTLLIKDPSQLTDEELAELVSVKEKLADELHWIERRVRWGFEEIQRYRARKKELDKLCTGDLEKRSRLLQESWAAAVASDDDFYDPGGDSLYEAPPMDSDEHIIHELLKERRGS